MKQVNKKEVVNVNRLKTNQSPQTSKGKLKQKVTKTLPKNLPHVYTKKKEI